MTQEKVMKLTTIALATTFTLISTFAFAQSTTTLAQSTETIGRGTVTAPSVGSYQHPVGTTNVLPSWKNTGPAADSARTPYGSPFATR
jgi:hypothetical protein